MGTCGDQRSRLLSKAPLSELKDAVQKLLAGSYLEPVSDVDQIDEDEADEFLWITWGQVAGYSVAEFSALDEEAERLLFSNAEALSKSLSVPLVVVHEGRSAAQYREYAAGKVLLSWSDMMGPVDGTDEDYNWLESFSEKSADLDIHAFLQSLMQERLGFSRPFYCEDSESTAHSWAEQESETVWYGDV